MQVAVVLQLQGEGRLRHHEHVRIQRLVVVVSHLTVDLRDQGAGAGIIEEASVVAGLQVRELLLQGLVHHLDREGIHGSVDHKLAFHVFVRDLIVLVLRRFRCRLLRRSFCLLRLRFRLLCFCLRRGLLCCRGRRFRLRTAAGQQRQAEDETHCCSDRSFHCVLPPVVLYSHK